MAVKSIAVKADVSTELAPGSKPFTGYDSDGAWSEVSLSVETLDVLTIAGAAVAWKANASFQYAGTMGGNPAPPSAPSPVTLTGTSTALTATGKALLRDGDSAEDSFGNKITVSADHPLRSE